MIGIHDNEIIIVPEIKINQNEMHEIYAISRDSLEIKTIPNNSFLDNHINWIKFQYILGTYLINKIYYFVFVEQSKLIYPQLDIYQISSINIIQITPGDENHHVIEMIRHAFSFNNIYYSSKYNLYNSFSVKFNNNREIFIWNHLAIELSKQVFHHKLDNLLLPVINGSVSFFDNFCLISRRSFIQCSVRFWIRGADKDGNSANFIETEEVVIINDKEIKSFIQIRGSIPVHWTEYPNLTFLPKIIVDERNESFERCRKHFKLLSNLYDKVKVINLTSEKGRETQLTELYKKCCKKLEIEYHHIDTEQLCGVFHWNKLGLEINKIEIGFPNFSLIKDGITNIAQEYVIRTNCADSIDRTNVIQCEIGLKVYLEMIHHSKKSLNINLQNLN